ncbi:hypothetical protein AAVH_24145, partial [Aphelenchoides avenae]
HPKYKQLKAEMDEKVREIGTLNKRIEEEKIKFNCMWEKAVELEKNKDTMEREIAELKRRADGRSDNTDEAAELTQELRNQHREIQRLQREVDDLRKENDSRRTRIRELERQLADAKKKAANAPTSSDRLGSPRVTVSIAHEEMDHQPEETCFPKIPYRHGDPPPPLAETMLDRIVNTVAIFAQKNVLLFGGHQENLREKLLDWGYQWPAEEKPVFMEFIASPDVRDPWASHNRMLYCRVTRDEDDRLPAGDPEFACPDPNEVVRVFFQEQMMTDDDSMQRLYNYMLMIFMKPDVCSLPMTVYVFSTVAMVLARNKDHFASFVSRYATKLPYASYNLSFSVVSKCTYCADLLDHVRKRYRIENSGHADREPHEVTKRRKGDRSPKTAPARAIKKENGSVDDDNGPTEFLAPDDNDYYASPPEADAQYDMADVARPNEDDGGSQEKTPHTTASFAPIPPPVKSSPATSVASNKKMPQNGRRATRTSGGIARVKPLVAPPQQPSVPPPVNDAPPPPAAVAANGGPAATSAINRSGDDRFEDGCRYRMNRFLRKKPGMHHRNKEALATKDPDKTWKLKIHEYSTQDAGMNRVLDALAEPIPRRTAYDDFVRMFNAIVEHYPPKIFLDELLEERSAAKLLERFTGVYELNTESFASFLYCKVVVKRTG